MGTKHPMSTNSSHLMKPCSSHRPFTLSCATTNLSSTSYSMQTTNHPLVTPLVITNYTPRTNVPYRPPTFHVNEGSKLYTIPNPFNHAQLRHFPPPILLVPTISHDHTPQPTPISSTRF